MALLRLHFTAASRAGWFFQRSLTVKLPDDLSFEDAATMRCCVAASMYSLLGVGGRMKGQVSVPSPITPTEFDFERSVSQRLRSVVHPY